MTTMTTMTKTADDNDKIYIEPDTFIKYINYISKHDKFINPLSDFISKICIMNTNASNDKERSIDYIKSYLKGSKTEENIYKSFISSLKPDENEFDIKDYIDFDLLYKKYIKDKSVSDIGKYINDGKIENLPDLFIMNFDKIKMDFSEYEISNILDKFGKSMKVKLFTSKSSSSFTTNLRYINGLLVHYISLYTVSKRGEKIEDEKINSMYQAITIINLYKIYKYKKSITRRSKIINEINLYGLSTNHHHQMRAALAFYLIDGVLLRDIFKSKFKKIDILLSSISSILEYGFGESEFKSILNKPEPYTSDIDIKENEFLIIYNSNYDDNELQIDLLEDDCIEYIDFSDLLSDKPDLIKIIYESIGKKTLDSMNLNACSNDGDIIKVNAECILTELVHRLSYILTTTNDSELNGFSFFIAFVFKDIFLNLYNIKHLYDCVSNVIDDSHKLGCKLYNSLHKINIRSNDEYNNIEFDNECIHNFMKKFIKCIYVNNICYNQDTDDTLYDNFDIEFNVRKYFSGIENKDDLDLYVNFTLNPNKYEINTDDIMKFIFNFKSLKELKNKCK